MGYYSNIILNDAIKTYTNDQDKIISPLETIKKFKPMLNSCGFNILEEIIRIDNGRLDIPIFFSLCGSDANKIIGTKKQMGKGATKDQAKASALMELAERYSFLSFYKDSSNFIIDNYNNIGPNVLSFREIAKSVQDTSDDLELSENIFKTLPLRWTGAYDLTSNKEMLIPLDWFYSINAFNGSSAGNCIEEALCQGICEIVERHVSSLISREKTATPLINLNSIKDKVVLGMIDKYVSLGIKIYITDFSLAIGIPSIGVLAYDPSTFPMNSEIVWTAGTSPDPNKALSRALSEVAQLAGDFNSNSNYVASGLPKFNFINEFNKTINLKNSVDLMKLPNISNQNIKIEIENCVGILSKLDMTTLAINTTHPLIKVPATYSIISGTSFRERAKKKNVSFFLAKVISETFSPQIAIKYLKKMDKVLSKKYFLYFYIGKCYLTMKKYDIAISYFYRATELVPNEQDISMIYSYIAISLKEIGKYVDAIQILEKVELIDEEKSDIHNLKGFCFYMLKKYDRSIASFKKSILLNPSSAIDYANMALSYKKLGDRNKAKHYYQISLSIDPSIEFSSNII